jgi:transcriptional regulator with XRE-family HTH domain
MRITIDHPASKFGMPVILHPDGSVMKYPDGLKLLRRRQRMSTRDLGAICGVSPRTIERWEQNLSIPTAAALNAMSKLPLDTVVPRPIKPQKPPRSES